MTARSLVSHKNGPTRSGRIFSVDFNEVATFRYDRPPAVSPITAWYRADQGITLDGSGKVSQWNNLVNPTLPITQSSAGLRPVYFASGGIGQHPAVAFSGTFLGNASFTTSQPNTIYIVGYTAQLAAFEEFIDNGFNTGRQVIYATPTSVGFYADGSTIEATCSASQPTVFCGVFNGTTSSLHVNAASASIVQGNPGTAGLVSLEVGSGHGGASAMNGRIAEMLFYSGAHNTTQRQQVMSYLQDRYGASIGIAQVTNPGRSTGGQAVNPINFPGMVVWYRADYGLTFSGQNVITWSPYYAAPGFSNPVTQSVAANGPTFMANFSNGWPALTFNSQTLGSAPWTGSLSQPFTAYLISRTTSSAVSQIATDGLTAGDRFVFAGNDGGANNMTFYAGAGGCVAVHNWAAGDIVAAVVNSTNGKGFVSGVLAASGNIGTHAPTGLRFGNQYTVTAGFWWLGEIAELLIFSGAHTDNQIAQMASYAAAKYGLWQHGPRVIGGTSLAFSRNSAPTTATAQVNLSNIVTGFSIDVPRFGRTNNVEPFGLILEPQRQNIISQSRDVKGLGWTAGTATTTTNFAFVGPDGIVAASRHQMGSGQVSNYYLTPAVISQSYVGTMWARASGSGLPKIQGDVNDNSVATTVFVDASGSDMRWKRYGGRVTISASNIVLIPEDSRDQSAAGGFGLGSYDVFTDFHQLELGRHATEVIPNSGSMQTRAGERLYHPSASQMFSSLGRFALEVRAKLKGGILEQDGVSVRVYHFDSLNFAAINTSNGVLTVGVSGSPDWISSGSIRANAGDVLELFVATGGGRPTRASYRVNSGSTINLGRSLIPQANMVSTGSVDIFCNGTVQQLASWIWNINAYDTFSHPDWIDSPTLWKADFYALTPGSASNLFGFSFSRASAATIQTTVSTVLSSGITNNVARVGWTGTARGLVIEESRSNALSYSRDISGSLGNWQPSSQTTVTLNSKGGPDGVVQADRLQISSNGFSAYYDFGTDTQMAFSIWGRANAAGVNDTWVPAIEPTGGAAGAIALYLTGIPATFQRQSISMVGRYAVPCDARSTYPGTVAGARDVILDYAQVELGAKFPTEAIPTTGSGASRSGERLYRLTGSDCIDSGSLNLEYVLYPKGSSGSYTFPVRLWSDSGNTGSYIEMHHLNNSLTCSYSGSTSVLTGMPGWNSGDLVKFFISFGGGLATLARVVVNTGSVVTLHNATNAFIGPITVTGSSEFMCAGTTNQFSAHVSSIRAYKAGKFPDWAGPYLWKVNFEDKIPGATGLEGTGFTLTRGSPATIQTSPSGVLTGIRGTPYSLQFVSTSLQYGSANLMPFANATKVTICGWIKIAPNPTHAVVIYETGTVYNDHNGMGLFQNGNENGGQASSLYIAHRDQTNSKFFAGYSANQPTDTWLRFCHVIDQSVSFNQGRLYINGVSQSLTVVNNDNCTAGIDTKNLSIGVRNATQYPLSGNLILDFIKTGYAYSGADALADYQNSSNVLPSGSTIFQSDWSEGSGSVVYDYASGKNITLFNNPTWSSDIPSQIANRKVGRIGWDGFKRGLCIEESRINQVSASRGNGIVTTGWTAGIGTSTITLSQSSPDDTLSAARLAVSGASTSPYISLVSQTANFVASQWIRKGSGTGVYQLLNGYGTLAGTAALSLGTGSINWFRTAMSFSYSAQLPFHVPNDGRDNSANGGFTAGVRDAVMDLFQFEVGKFPTEAIVTIGVSASRAGDRLYRATGSDIVNNNRISLEFVFYPKGASTQYSQHMRLWSDSRNTGSYIEINSGSQLITMSLNGLVNTTDKITWAANDAVRLFIANGNGKNPQVVWKINDGAAVVAGTTGSWGDVFVTGSSEFFCTGSSNQLSAYIGSITAYVSGAFPGWIIGGFL